MESRLLSQKMSISFVPYRVSRDRYSAKKMAKPVNFVCNAPGAKRVFLSGDFNDWSTSSHPMARQPDGAWFLQIQLHHGHHRYRFIVDGEPMLDPKAQGTTRNRNGDEVSLKSIS